MKRSKLSLVIAIILCFLFVGITAENAFGSAWIGDDGGSSSSGGGSGGSRDCRRTGKGYNNAECNGAAWVFYEYMGGHDNESVHFAPGYSSRNIPGDCARSDIPGYGFWHLGFYVEFNNYHNPLTADLLSSPKGGVYGTDYNAAVGYTVVAPSIAQRQTRCHFIMSLTKTALECIRPRSMVRTGMV